MAALLLTIPSDNILSDLNDYVIMIRLSDMPSIFWLHTKNDGGDIRIKTIDEIQLCQDIVRFDYDSKDGVVFFKANFSATFDNLFKIYYGNSVLNKFADNDTYGKHAVWSNYETVMIFGESGGEDRTGKFDQGKIFSDPSTFEIIETSSVDLNSHQGICWDGTYYYTVDTNSIYKWDFSWNLIDQNSDPIGDTLISLVNHLGDPEYYNGNLYIPLEVYPNSPYNNQHIVVFSTFDLSFITSFDISAQAHEVSSIAYCALDELFYVTDYTDGSKIFKYDLLVDGSYQGYLNLDKKILKTQGITWWRDYFWINGDEADETFRVSYSGIVSSGNVNPLTGSTDPTGNGIGGLFGSTVIGGNYEGIGSTNETLLVLVDPSSAIQYVNIYKPYDINLGVGGGIKLFNTNQEMRANERNSYTTFTLGVSAIMNVKDLNSVPLSYWDESSGTTNTRVSIAFRASTEIGFGLWDVNNSWLMSNPLINPVIEEAYRLHAVYNGTTHRKLFINGELSNIQNTILEVPNTLDTLLVGKEDLSSSESWNGKIGFVYLYPGILSDDWIKTEYNNINNPELFYIIENIVENKKTSVMVIT